eukprot:Pgem_evm1s9801
MNNVGFVDPFFVDPFQGLQLGMHDNKLPMQLNGHLQQQPPPSSQPPSQTLSQPQPQPKPQPPQPQPPQQSQLPPLQKQSNTATMPLPT